MQYELNRSKFWVGAAKKSGMPMDDIQAARRWIKENQDFSSEKVWNNQKKRAANPCQPIPTLTNP